MWRASQPTTWAIAIACAIFSTASVQGQDLPPYSGKGTLDGTTRGYIKMTDSSGTPYLVKILDTAKITVVGTAEPGFLKPGLIVRMTAELNSKGIAQSELTEISIIELSDLINFTLQADLAPGEDINDQKGPVNYLVIGRVKSFKNGQLQVVAPGKVIKAKLAEDAKINVDVTDYSWAQEGDVVSVDGKLYMPGQVIADKVQIEMAKPLAPKGKRRPPSKSTRKGKKPTEESPLAEDEPKT